MLGYDNSNNKNNTKQDDTSMYFKIVKFWLTTSGLWISSKERRRNIFLNLTFIICLSVGIAGSLRVFFTTTEGFAEINETLIQIGLMSHSLLTYSVLVYNQKKILQMYSIVENRFNNFESVLIMKNNFRQREERSSAYMSLFLTATIASVDVSYVYATKFFHFHLDHTKKQLLFPMDLFMKRNNYTYYFIYLFEVVLFLIQPTVHISSITFCVGFMNTLSGQFSILGSAYKSLQTQVIHDIKECKELSCKRNRGNHEDIHANKLIKLYIEHHHQLIEFSKLIQSAFSITLFDIFVTSEFMLCFSTFQTYQMFKYMSLEHLAKSLCMLSALLVHEFVYFWYGEKLNGKTVSFRDDVYSANWYNHSKRFKSAFRIVQERIKKPILIQAGTIIPANLDAFIKCLQAAFSYFNLLLALSRRSQASQ